jgi:GntR family transcriptional regulator, transcriptional repressor for pyruvate dehydrogenase complex
VNDEATTVRGQPRAHVNDDATTMRRQPRAQVNDDATTVRRQPRAQVNDDAATVRRQPRVHEYVADQLRREIALGLFASRRSLPPERELAAIFGVGIMAVHRAVHMLEEEVLVTSKRGRNGGTFVVGDARADSATRRLQARVRKDRQKIEEALDCRMEVEPQVAARAARHRTRSDLADLRELLDAATAASDDVEFTKLDARFHLKIAQAAHNQFLAGTLEQVRAVLHVVVLLLPDTPLWQQRSLTDHRQILEAVAGGQPTQARQAAARHVRRTVVSARALLHSLQTGEAGPQGSAPEPEQLA